MGVDEGFLILAMDISLTQPGFAVLQVVHNKVYVVELRYVTTNSKESHGHRLKQINDVLVDLLIRYDFKYVVREKGFSRHAHVTQTIYKVMGITELSATEYGFNNVVDLAVTTVKKQVTGNGKASKEEVARSVFQQIENYNPDWFHIKQRNGRMKLIDDLSDACAVGIAFLRQEGYIE